MEIIPETRTMIHATVCADKKALAVLFSLSSLLLVFLSGCDVPAALVGKGLPGETIKPKYAAMQGQSIGVLVWTDRGVQLDYPSLNLDLANSIQKKLMGNAKSPVLKGAIFPVQPASIARYVLDHPNFDVKNVTEIAPRFGVTRLIYVEVTDFGTRAQASVELLRGHMDATLKVVEVSGESAAVVYDDNALKASFPPKVPEDGTPDGDDERFYAGTVDAMSTEVVHRLVSYESPDID
jgi:hypothetical protein